MALGMRAAIDEVKKNLSPDRLNRVLVLTDGQTYEETACIDLVEKNRDQISFSTMGVGVEFNEKLLQRLAQDSNGKYHFIGDPAEIPEYFRRRVAGTALGQPAQRANRGDAVAGRAGARGISRVAGDLRARHAAGRRGSQNQLRDRRPAGGRARLGAADAGAAAAQAGAGQNFAEHVPLRSARRRRIAPSPAI